jgi:pyrroline-5-carboxylate reductase
MNEGESMCTRIGVIGGGGWLGRAVLDAIVEAKLVAPEELGLSYRSKEPEKVPAVFRTRESQALVDWADIVVVSVRPADWPALEVSARGKLAISVMAGITSEQLAARLRTDRIIRAMPNVAASVRRSYTPWIASPGATASDRSVVTRILEACGTSDEVASEGDLDYLTGLTGSGPAFPALLAEALRSDAVARGIDPAIARRAVTELLIGTGKLFEEGYKSTAEVVDEFVAYRGVLAAAIDTMRAAGFDASVHAGLAAALQKAASMGQSD